MQKLPILIPGDTVEIVAPASKCTDKQLLDLRSLLLSWDLQCVVKGDIFGDDILCAHNDVTRLKHLEEALLNPDVKAVVCARGGYGSMRLIPELMHITPPKAPKLFVGMSDITALHLFLQQHWHWPTVHASLTQEKCSEESIAALKSLLFGFVDSAEFTEIVPLNECAQKHQHIQSSVVGGNLTLIQTGIGTNWQVDARGKILLLEEVSERGYRVDRMLEHLYQAYCVQEAAAIIFADFLGCEEPDGSSIIDPILTRFAKRLNIPVIRMKGVGHDKINYPIPLGTKASLSLGQDIQLTCFR
jgi:muramoyltetrapeptide carboxypeptidase